MSQEDWSLLALGGLPLVAVVCVGMLARRFVDGEMRRWGLWVLLLVLACGSWAYIFTGMP